MQSPVRDIKRLLHAKARDRRLLGSGDGEDSEETRLLKACGKARIPYLLLPVVLLALETAMRRSELISLGRENIGRHRRTARLPDSKTAIRAP